jgi:hypothetical protein
MNVIQNPRQLLGAADSLLRKADDAEARHDRRAMAELRREGERISAELAAHVRTDHSLSLLKAAQATPRSLFESSAGARKAARLYSEDERKTMAATGHAMPDGSYPIKTADDIATAVENWKNAGGRPDAKKHISRRATELGALHLVPDDWRGGTAAGGDNPSKMARASTLRKFGR